MSEMNGNQEESYIQVSEDNEKITIQDVAEALGISKTTVSRAISGKGRIGESTRARVLEYIEKKGYKPNPIAKGLAQQRTYNVGWVMPGDSDITELPFFQKCMRGVCEEAANNDYDVLLSFIYDDSISGLERMVKGNKVDGVILGRTLVDDKNVAYLKDSGIPFVVIGSTTQSDVVQVDNDHVNACRELASILILKGNKRIILIGGNDTHVVNQTRREGYELGVADNAGKVISSKVYMNADSPERIEEIISTALRDDIDCVVCMDDMICTRVLDVLSDKGIHIPANIKVASFYNSELLANVQPGITALKYEPKELGAKACDILISYINGEKVPSRTLMNYEVLLRGSTK